MTSSMGETFSDRLERSYAAVASELPDGWSLSLRCISTGAEPEERSGRWLAVAEAADGQVVEGRGPDPERALAALHAQLTT